MNETCDRLTSRLKLAATHKEETAESCSHIEIRAPAAGRKLAKRDSESIDSDDSLEAHITADCHQKRLKISRKGGGHGDSQLATPPAKVTRLDAPHPPRLDQDNSSAGVV